MGNIPKCMFLKRSYAKDQHVPKKMLSTTRILGKNTNQHHNDLFTTVLVREALIKKTKTSKC